MLRVGLTGGIASGKTTVAGMFSARGCKLLSADRMAHEVIAQSQPAYNEVIRVFGPEIVGSDGAIDRARLGSLVFADRVRLTELNRIVHPRVIARIEEEFERLAATDPIAIALVEAALLVETDYYRKLDKLILTWCSPTQQIERLIQQAGFSRAEAEQRIAAQMPLEEKRQYADYEIDCSGSLATTETQVDSVFHKLRRLADRAAPDN